MLELTAFGAVWGAVLLCLFFLPLRCLATALLFSSVFQAAAVLNAGGKGLMPLLLTEMAFLLRWALGALSGTVRRAGAWSRRMWATLAFVFCACALTLFLPLFFEGTSFMGLSYGGVAYPQKARGFGDVARLNGENLRKVFSLFLHGASLLVLLHARALFTEKQLFFAIKISIAGTALVGLWETAHKWGLTPLAFPAGFFYSNAGYTLKGLAEARTNFTFAEPSYAGGFFAAALVGALAAGRKQDRGCTLLLMLAFALALAGTAAVTLAAGLVFLLAMPGAGGRRKRWRLAGFGALLVAGLAASGYGARYWGLVAGKPGSFSGLERMAGNLYGLRVFAKTAGLGAGLGTVRTFSFGTELLSSLGLVGAVLYAAMLLQLLRPLWRQKGQSCLCRFALLFNLAHLVAQCVALPDLTTPTLWFGLFAAACAGNIQPSPIRVTQTECCSSHSPNIPAAHCRAAGALSSWRHSWQVL